MSRPPDPSDTTDRFVTFEGDVIWEPTEPPTDLTGLSIDELLAIAERIARDEP